MGSILESLCRFVAGAAKTQSMQQFHAKTWVLGVVDLRFRGMFSNFVDIFCCVAIKIAFFSMFFADLGL